MSTRRLLRILPWFVVPLLLWWVVSTVPPRETWAVLTGLGGGQIITLAALNLLILALLNARWWFLLRGLGAPVPFLALLGYRLASFGVSYFTPGPQLGGEPLQVYLVEKERAVRRSTAVAAVSLDKALELLVNFALLLAGLIVVVQNQLLGAALARGVLLFAVMFLLLPLVYLVVLWHERRPLTALLDIVQRALPAAGNARWQRLAAFRAGVASSEAEAGRVCRRAPGAMLAALTVSGLSWLLMVAEFWLVVSFLGVALTPLQLVTTLTAARVAFFLLLPAGLGALEASQTLAFTALGLNPVVGLSASLLIRARDVLIGAAGLWWGSRKLAKGQTTRRQT